MKTFGIIGFPLGHSLSARFFSEKFAAEGLDGYEYLKFEMESIEELGGIREKYPSLCGFNVTLPHKQSVMRFLDSTSDEAAGIGAVNCVRVDARGRLHGHNTDAYGFRTSLLDFIGDKRPAALVLGSGGAARAVCYVLGRLGIAFRRVSRNPGSGQVGYGDVAGLIDSHTLIVNTTPLGMFPDTDSAPPLPYHLVTAGHSLYDLVYNPTPTKFLSLGAERGARTVGGYAMWLAQALKSWEIWNDLR